MPPQEELAVSKETGDMEFLPWTPFPPLCYPRDENLWKKSLMSCREIKKTKRGLPQGPEHAWTCLAHKRGGQTGYLFACEGQKGTPRRSFPF